MSSFPETRHTLIQRLAVGRSETDWRQFLADYWQPVCRFALRWGRLTLDEADDVASITLVAVLEGGLFERWLASRQAKLRTLLCAVIRNVLANRARVQAGRERILAEHGELLRQLGTVVRDDDASLHEQEDAFYAAWVETLLQSCLTALHDDYLRTGRGDYFRVLYGRICEGLGNQEVADLLRLKVSDVENYFKRSRQHLQERLQSALTDHVRRYTEPSDVDDEVRVEWQRLGRHLLASGGLEAAVRKSYELSDELHGREYSATTTILTSLGRHRPRLPKNP